MDNSINKEKKSAMDTLKQVLPFYFNTNLKVSVRDKANKITISVLSAEILVFWEDNFFVEFKPVLRPLSDLLDGGKLSAFAIINLVKEEDLKYSSYDKWLEDYLDRSDPSCILQAPFVVFRELLNCHYNVFNIPKDLWIANSP